MTKTFCDRCSAENPFDDLDEKVSQFVKGNYKRPGLTVRECSLVFLLAVINDIRIYLRSREDVEE